MVCRERWYSNDAGLEVVQDDGFARAIPSGVDPAQVRRTIEGKLIDLDLLLVALICLYAESPAVGPSLVFEIKLCALRVDELLSGISNRSSIQELLGLLNNVCRVLSALNQVMVSLNFSPGIVVSFRCAESLATSAKVDLERAAMGSLSAATCLNPSKESATWLGSN